MQGHKTTQSNWTNVSTMHAKANKTLIFASEPNGCPMLDSDSKNLCSNLTLRYFQILALVLRFPAISVVETLHRHASCGSHRHVAVAASLEADKQGVSVPRLQWEVVDHLVEHHSYEVDHLLGHHSYCHHCRDWMKVHLLNQLMSASFRTLQPTKTRAQKDEPN